MEKPWEMKLAKSGEFFHQNSSEADPDMNNQISNRGRTIKEMDFFSINRQPAAQGQDEDTKGAGSWRNDQAVNTGLDLLRVSRGSSPPESKEIPNNKLITLRLEMHRLHDENRKLRGMLDNIAENYGALQGQLISATQRLGRENRLEQDSREDSPIAGFSIV
ncbi:WRKY transcription factor [Asimina triloba]